MAEDDGGLPEESQGKLEQSNAVPVEGVGPYYNFNSSSRQIFENINDLYEYGYDIIYGRGQQSRGATTLFIVVDNLDESDLLFPNQPHWWVAERTPPLYLDSLPEDFRGDVFFTPLYKKMVERAEEGSRNYPRPPSSIVATTYKGVPVWLPDPTLDYSRPQSQTGATTGAATGATVITTTTILPNTTGGITESQTIPAEVSVNASNGSGSAVATNQTSAGRGNGAAEVAQRRANAAVSSRSASTIVTGTTPLLPNNPPASASASGSGGIAPASILYDDAILRQSRAAAAAPISSIQAQAANGSRAVETVTTPTTVTQAPSTPTNANQSTATPSSSNVYIYEPLTPGFDRYDFNTGKKVYTPDAGPSRNSSAQPVSPQSTPRVSTTANNPDTAPTRPLPTRPGQTRLDRTPSQLSPGQISGPF